MSQTKSEQGDTEKQTASGNNLEDQYRKIGISAVAAAAAYTCKAAKPSQKT